MTMTKTRKSSTARSASQIAKREMTPVSSKAATTQARPLFQFTSKDLTVIKAHSSFNSLKDDFGQAVDGFKAIGQSVREYGIRLWQAATFDKTDEQAGELAGMLYNTAQGASRFKSILANADHYDQIVEIARDARTKIVEANGKANSLDDYMASASRLIANKPDEYVETEKDDDGNGQVTLRGNELAESIVRSATNAASNTGNTPQASKAERDANTFRRLARKFVGGVLDILDKDDANELAEFIQVVQVELDSAARAAKKARRKGNASPDTDKARAQDKASNSARKSRKASKQARGDVSDTISDQDAMNELSELSELSELDDSMAVQFAQFQAFMKMQAQAGNPNKSE